MVKIKKGNKVWDYPNDVMEAVKINTNIKKDFAAFCKKRKLNKSKLVEAFYTAILIKFRDGSLNASGGYITMNILTQCP